MIASRYHSENTVDVDWEVRFLTKVLGNFSLQHDIRNDSAANVASHSPVVVSF
jgi:hypothetical protein